MTKKRLPITHLAPLAALIVLLSGCGALFDGAAPRRVSVQAPVLSVAWDPPADSRSDGAVTSYRVYARARGSAYWRFVGSVAPTKKPSFTIRIGESSLGYGSYEFAVSTVGIGGVESQRHSSLDVGADPASGWYVDWYGPPEWYLDWQDGGDSR